MKITNGSDNIFRDLGFGEVEAESLKLRSTLMIRITKIVRASNMTQAEAASVFGVTQPRLNQLLKGKIQLFSLDALVNMLAQAGMRVNGRTISMVCGCKPHGAASVQGCDTDRAQRKPIIQVRSG